MSDGLYCGKDFRTNMKGWTEEMGFPARSIPYVLREVEKEECVTQEDD
jgi:hypothetical protein